MELSPYFKEKQRHIDTILMQHLPPTLDSASPLGSAMHYSVLNGGKRLRPLLVYATGEGFSVHTETLDMLSCAVEFIHCYSLIHDDLPAMDDDDLRRGKPSCHIAFDEATAILAGDALQSLAFEILASHPSPHARAEQRLEFITILAQACGIRGMAEGQARDMMLTGQTPSRQQVHVIHHLKTACLLQGSVKLAATAANLKDITSLMHLDEFSRCLGLAFQIKDDILDAEASTQLLGKKQGADVKNGKATYLSTTGLDHAKHTLKQLVNEASEHLAHFGERLGHLRELLHYVAQRKY